MLHGYRVVNLFTEDHAALTGARQVVIESNLKPEKSWNANFNFLKYFILKKGIVTTDASLFYTYFTNRIIADFASDANKISYNNLNGYAISRGASLSIDFAFENGLKLIFASTYMDVYSMQKDSSNQLQRIEQLHAPKFSGNFTMSYTFTKLGLSIDYTGIVKSPMYLPIVPNDFRPEQSPWFTLQNIQLSKKFKKGIEIYAGVKNLFDFVPKDPILRPFDPFDKHITENNPFGYTFDPSYNYAPIQGRRYFLGIRYILN
jgi:outer membrane receptor for ferrienterochelin and colicins